VSASRPPFALQCIDHVVLIVDGMEEALAFYGDVLGAKPEGDLMQFGMMQLRAGASMIDLVDVGIAEGVWARPEVGGGRNMDHLCLDVGPVEAAAMKRHLKAHGVEVFEEGVRSGAKGEDYSWYIRDPWGNAIELKRSGG
jgi:catechol 2,3-dioxygenase-like lactoylglutathione lyase family enzyme